RARHRSGVRGVAEGTEGDGAAGCDYPLTRQRAPRYAGDEVAPRAILLPGGVMPADLAYGALLEALGDDAEAIAKDLEVYAGPDPPPDYSLDYEIDGVLRAAREAGFERFHLVGYSGGGASSLAFAARHPERLLSLTLIEPAWLGNDGLSAEEQAVRREFDRMASLPPEPM